MHRGHEGFINRDNIPNRHENDGGDLYKFWTKASVNFMDPNFKHWVEVDPEGRDLGLIAGDHSGHVVTAESLRCVNYFYFQCGARECHLHLQGHLKGHVFLLTACLFNLF